jgi:hypothetical protein
MSNISTVKLTIVSATGIATPSSASFTSTEPSHTNIGRPYYVVEYGAQCLKSGAAQNEEDPLNPVWNATHKFKYLKDVRHIRISVLDDASKLFLGR